MSETSEKVHIHLHYDKTPEKTKEIQNLMSMVDAVFHIHVQGEKHIDLAGSRLATAIGQGDQFRAKHHQMMAERYGTRQARKQTARPKPESWEEWIERGLELARQTSPYYQNQKEGLSNTESSSES